MATDNEMRAAGIHLPGGSDYIKDGDDAISANARVLWDRIEAARFDQTAVPLGASDVFDDLPTNIYTWWSGESAEALGMPFVAQGTMIMSRWGSAGGVALAASRSTTPTLWINSRLSGGWSGWTQIGGTPEPVQQLKTAGPAGLKTAPLALTTGYGGARTSGTGTTSVIQHLPAATTRLQLRMRNWNPRYTNSDRAAVTLTGVRIGRHTSGGNGTNWINLPAGSTEYASQWIDVPAALRGGEIVVQYTWSGSDVTQCLGTAWTDGSTDQRPPLFVWLALEVPSTTPVVAAFGSSTAAGVGAARPLIDSWLAQWARANDAVPAFWAHSGDSASSWTEKANRKWELYGDGINAPDAMLYAMGSNDWAGGASLEELQTRIASTVAEIRRRIGGTLYGTTITPRATPPSNDNTRLALNEWMETSGLFHGVLDFAGAVALPDGTLDPAVDADGVHVTTAGHARLAAAITYPLVSDPNAITYGWSGTPHASESIKYVGGREVARNRAINPSFEVSASTGLIVGSEVTLSGRTSVASRVSQGTHSTILSWVDDGSTSEVQGIVQQDTAVSPGQWVAVSVDVATASSGVLYAAGIITERGDSNNHITHHYPGEYAQVGQNVMTTFTYAVQVTDPDVAVARAGLRFSGTPGTYSLPRAWGYIDGFHIAVADTEAAARAQVAAYFDGDSPTQNRLDLLEARLDALIAQEATP
ncbi:SGNH/GDSL hydrolase family protein [Brachybacterium massiliense]|uniref:SGNH/GDSL hydrolase family protein n=1 Tax=Brachybacterium massiliense TaxID=1755098 RepID=UPI00111E94FA|nr:SGNH/GDSL hydrolase family protein [Brachybacterium massiliense]